MNHIIFVCQVFYPDSGATSQLFTHLFRRLSREGVQVTVISGYPYKLPPGYHGTLPRHEQVDGIDISRCGLNIDTRRNFVFRALAYATFLLHAAWKLLRLKPDDYVFGVTNPPFLAIILWLTSRFSHFRYDYMLHDINPEGMIRLGMMDVFSPITRFWMVLNRQGYMHAGRLAVLGRDMVPLLQRNYDIAPDRIHYIPNWSPVDIVCPLTFHENSMVERLKLQHAFVVQYSGNMGLWNDMDTLVRMAAQLRDEQPHIQFLFIGGGFRRPPAEQLAQQLGATNIIWHDYVALEELPVSLAACHVALISLNSGLGGVAVPCKIYGILATGRAILAQVPRESEIAYVVQEEACGLVVEPGDVAGLVGALHQLASNPELVQQMGERAFQAYRTKYTLDHAVTTFRDFWQLD
jgi:glycosyltransferase involved in cell wall biosynthesis